MNRILNKSSDFLGAGAGITGCTAKIHEIVDIPTHIWFSLFRKSAAIDTSLYIFTSEWELFDLKNEPGEMQNQYLNPPCAGVVKAMTEILQKGRFAVDDIIILKATTDYHR